jgi:hypothetical protein
VLKDQQCQLARFTSDGHGSAAERGFVRKQAGERVAIDRTQVHISPADVEVDWRIRQREPSVVQLDRERQLGSYTRGGQASAADRSVLERHLREKIDIHRTQAEIPKEDLEEAGHYMGKGKA